MNTRFLFILSLVVTLFAVWFYRNQGELESPASIFETNVEYQATDILAIQTNSDGVAEYSLMADKLTNYAAENTDKLENVVLHWRPNTEQNVKITAEQAIMYHEKDEVIMKNNVVFVNNRLQDALANADSLANEKTTNNRTIAQSSVQPPLYLEASELIGNLAQKKIYSHKPIVVTQAENKFEAAHFNADISTGDYEFAKVAVTYTPPPRNDVDLF